MRLKALDCGHLGNEDIEATELCLFASGHNGHGQWWHTKKALWFFSTSCSLCIQIEYGAPTSVAEEKKISLFDYMMSSVNQ